MRQKDSFTCLTWQKYLFSSSAVCQIEMQNSTQLIGGSHLEIFNRFIINNDELDRIRNERIRGTAKVGEIVKKVQESRLKWYGHTCILGTSFFISLTRR